MIPVAALLLATLATVTEHPASGVNSQGLEIEHIMIEWNEVTGDPVVMYASIRSEDASSKKTFSGIQFTVDIGFDSHIQGTRNVRPRCGRYLVFDGDKGALPAIFVGIIQKVVERPDCSAKGLSFSAITEIPRQKLKVAQKASAAAVRFPARSKVHMIALASCDLQLERIKDKPVAALTVRDSEILSGCKVIGPMPPAPDPVDPIF